LRFEVRETHPIRPPPDLLRKRRPPEHSPYYSEMPIIVGNSENVGQRYNADVVVMKFGLAMQHRPFSFGEGIRGMRPSSGPDVQECDATKPIRELQLATKTSESAIKKTDIFSHLPLTAQ
jgi:hypothetical protein